MSATLNPHHADDTGALDALPTSAGRDWFTDRPDVATWVTTDLTRHPELPGTFIFDIRTEVRPRATSPSRERGHETNVSEQWLRQMRALIDRALGDRT